MTTAPSRYDEVGECVDAALRQLGKRIVIATPLGLGKHNPLLNEFYRRAGRDPTLQLTIITALSLQRPRAHGELEARLVDPLVERIFGDYVELDYVKALHAGTLPPNVTVREFYLEAGAWLGVAPVQQNYLSTNYTQVPRDIAAAGVNVIVQQIATRTLAGRTEYSLGSNPDLTLDLIDLVHEQGRDLLMIGAVNRRMPFMLGEALVPEMLFTSLLDHPRYDYDLYCPPNLPLGTIDHSIALHASALIRDGGSLQIGIGELGDALVYALQLRHQNAPQYAVACQRLHGGTADAATETLIEHTGGRSPFTRGLYACSEMFIDGFLDLYRSGILKRAVYQDLSLQRVLNAGRNGTRVDAQLLEAMVAAGLGPQLNAADVTRLQAAGVFAVGVRIADDALMSPDGRRLSRDLSSAENLALVAASCLGQRLAPGTLLDAAFLLGPRGFYGALHALSKAERELFNMRRVSYTNRVTGPGFALKAAQRRDARFVNSTMMATLLGAAISDALDSGQVVSGVGGQHEFVSMAQALPDARSLLCLRSTRTKNGRTTSNIVFNYGHTTIARHQRDLFVTEYGVADLRGRTDAECIAAMLNIADSRFQPELLQAAQQAGKLPSGYRIAERYRNNTPAALEHALAPLRAAGLFSEFPFGTDLSSEEIVLTRALRALAARTATRWGKLTTVAAAWGQRPSAATAPYLQRLCLAAPRNRNERRYARLVTLALNKTLGAAGP